MRASVLSTRSLSILFLLLLCLPCRAAAVDPRVVRPTASVDRNANKIADRLEQPLAAAATAGITDAGLLVALDHAPQAADFARIKALGCTVAQSWDKLVYLFHVKLAAKASLQAQALALSKLPGATFVEENPISRITLCYSTRQLGARTAWAEGYQGSSNTSIAIMDTGIDDSHADLSPRVTGWVDFAGAAAGTVGDEYATATDKNGHGTHVAGIAAGSGASVISNAGDALTTGTGQIPITYADSFPTQANMGWPHHFPVDTTNGPGTIGVQMKWANRDSSRNVGVDLVDDYGESLYAYAWSGTPVTWGDATQPWGFSYSGLSSGTVTDKYYALPFTGANNDSTAYWLQVKAPVSAVGDGYPLMRGVAPGSNLVGVKVMDDTGSGYGSQFISGLQWISANKEAQKIVAANASMNFGVSNSAIDTAVNNLVAQGVVFVASAGNGRGTGSPNCGSPGTASKAISVAATNLTDQISEYSSYGATGSKKPDVAAPGGSYSSGKLIVSADTNDGDPSGVAGSYTGDAFPNDYVSMQGTSMASPHIAGAAALVAQAMGTWSYTENQALRVKMLLLMTATETNSPAVVAPDPTLERGGRDTCEGYGRVNA